MATKPIAKKRKLSIKQQRFVRDVVATGEPTEAAARNYAVKNRITASVIASENLKKPYIADAILKALDDETLAKKHEQLLHAATLEKFFFDGEVDDSDIKDFVAKMPGYELMHIAYTYESSRKKKANKKIISKYAYVKAPDNVAQDKALDKAYKIKGTYAPEKKVELHAYTVAEEDRERIDKILEDNE